MSAIAIKKRTKTIIAVVRLFFSFSENLCFCYDWQYRYCAAVFASTLESYDAISESIECVIFAYAYVLAWMVFCTTLTNDDVASLNCFATEVLYTESF